MAISYSGCTCGAGGGGGTCECTPECVDTVCVLRCDDTNGDGRPDTTYSELWCIKADGTTQLVLTYQDDPAVPYAPVAPVDCQQGSVQCHNQVLCDDTGSFIRRYMFISDGTTGYTDVDLDGETPHLVTGTVRACDDNPCAGQDAPLATLGLCLADGTPIAAIVTRDCDGTIRQAGWLNLTTGTYSTGAPPVGVTACGETRSISTTGTFCDVLTDGTIAGLVLVEYTYGPDGAVTGVRLVDATTGGTYQPRGTVTACPAGDDPPEQDLVVLCETRPDGEVIRFLRDYRRDQAGAITGHTDYTLDGAAYQPAPGADISTCPPDCGVQQVIQAERCDDTNGDGLPDVWYVELLGVDCKGTVSTLGTYTCDLSATYAPVAPVDCDPDTGNAASSDQPPQVQARRAQLVPGSTWSASAWPLLRTVEAIAHGGEGEITTADGTTTLFESQSARWATSRDDDVRLTGPLTIAATTGTVTINFTTGVTP